MKKNTDMSNLPFDSLACAKRLKAVGFTDEQSELQAEILSETIYGNLATKRDLLDVQKDIEGVKTELKRDIEDVRVELKNDIRTSELRLRHDLVLQLGAIVVAGIGIAVGLTEIL